MVNVHRPKHNFTARDLTRILSTLWTQDDLIFIPERYRVQFTFIIHVYCYTGARLSAFFTGGLRYRDIDLALQRVSSRQWRVIYNVNQRWVKNNRDPENIVFGAAGKEHNLLVYDDVACLLTLAFADNALFGYDSLDQLLTQEIPPGDDVIPLRFKDSALDRPILRKCTKAGGVLDEPMPKAAFTDIFGSTLRNAGYLCLKSIHAIRRELGKKVDERYTPVQRSQLLTQGDPRVFGQSYVADISSVDGQAAFLGEAAEHSHIEYFQSLEKFRERGLPCSLTAELEEQLHRDPKILELESELSAHVQSDPAAAIETKRNLTSYRKTLKRLTLRKYQEAWIRERRDWKILTRGKQQAADVSRTDLVESLYLLIPERGRLARMMVDEKPMSPDARRQATTDLVSLCTRDLSVLYLPGLQPIGGACPVKCCQLRLETYVYPRSGPFSLTL